MDNICNVDNLDNVMLTLHLQRGPKNPARLHCLKFNGAARNYGSLLCTKAVALFSLLSYPKDSERPSWSDFQAEQRQKKKIWCFELHRLQVSMWQNWRPLLFYLQSQLNSDKYCKLFYNANDVILKDTVCWKDKQDYTVWSWKHHCWDVHLAGNDLERSKLGKETWFKTWQIPKWGGGIC